MSESQHEEQIEHAEESADGFGPDLELKADRLASEEIECHRQQTESAKNQVRQRSSADQISQLQPCSQHETAGRETQQMLDDGNGAKVAAQSQNAVEKPGINKIPARVRKGGVLTDIRV